MSKLNRDILFLIFEELQDDSVSLFTCLTVNRLWCETVVPILWRNPWRYDITYYNKNYLFTIIASYLSDDIKEFLTKQISPISSQSLLFDYLSFCRSINVNIMKYIISIGSTSADNRWLLQQKFYDLFMKKCPELKYLDMRSIEHQIFYLPEARLRFESLYELNCDTSINSSYLHGLAHISQCIQRLIIINNNVKANLGIVKLIEVQKSLKYFEWIDVCGYGLDRYKEILLALEKKADTISDLKIHFAHIDRTLQKVLPKLHNLKTLLINDFCYYDEEQLKMCIYHDLEIFKIENYNLKAASIIIENSGGHLKKILLGSYELEYIHNFHHDSLIFIRKVYENCPLIEYLTLAFPPSKHHSNEFENLLKICQNLKSLLLVMYDMEEEVTEENLLDNGEELLKMLIRSAPSNLREIRFLYDFKFSFEAFEEFLEKWRGRPALTILASNPTYKGENYLKLIDKYKYNGVIKDFRCESFINVVKYGLRSEYYVLPYLL
jgi:hypothetical protein